MSLSNKRFCCSCTPRDSSFAIAILLTVYSSFSFLASLKTLVRLYSVDTIKQFFDEIHASYGDIVPLSLQEFRAIAVTVLVISLIQVGANSSLIFGVIKEKANFLKVWLIVHKILLGVVTICFVVLAVLCFCKMFNTLVGVCFIIFGILHACVTIYFIAIVRCHHKILSETFTPFTNEYIMELPREKPYKTLE